MSMAIFRCASASHAIRQYSRQSSVSSINSSSATGVSVHRDNAGAALNMATAPRMSVAHVTILSSIGLPLAAVLARLLLREHCRCQRPDNEHGKHGYVGI